MTVHPHVSLPSAERPFRAPRWERKQAATWGALSMLAALIVGGVIWFDVGRDGKSAAAGGIAAPMAQIPAAPR